MNPVISELEAIRAEQELLPCPNPWCESHLYDDEKLWVNARNVMTAGSIAVVCIAAGLIGYAVGWL